MKINPHASKESLQHSLNIINSVIDAWVNPKPKRDPVSAAKIDANRRNALHSTGPKTDAGKQASSRNAIKHGIYAGTFVIPEEGRSEYAAFCDTYLDQFQPEGLEEQNLVQQMIAAQWRLLRLNVVVGVWDKSRGLLRRSESDPKPGVIEIEMEIAHDPDSLQALNRVLQMQSRLTREYNRAASQLKKLQKERQTAEPASPQPEPPAAEDSLNSSTSSTSSTSEIDKTNPTPPANAGIDPLKCAVETPVETDAEASDRNGLPDDHAYRE